MSSIEVSVTAGVDAGVKAGGVAVGEGDIGLGRAAESRSAEQVETTAGIETLARVDDQPGVRGGAAAGAAEAGFAHAATGAALEVLSGTESDPQEEQVQKTEEAELQGD